MQFVDDVLRTLDANMVRKEAAKRYTPDLVNNQDVIALGGIAGLVVAKAIDNRIELNPLDIPISLQTHDLYKESQAKRKLTREILGRLGIPIGWVPLVPVFRDALAITKQLKRILGQVSVDDAQKIATAVKVAVDQVDSVESVWKMSDKKLADLLNNN